MEERREISRIDFSAKGVIVVIDTEEKIMVEVANVSPLGMGVLVPVDVNADLVGKEIIIVADCMVMYATVNRMADYDDTHKIIGISGKSFNNETLSYLFEHIG